MTPEREWTYYLGITLVITLIGCWAMATLDKPASIRYYVRYQVLKEKP